MELASGARVGPYEIVAPLGAGGMGEVYLANDPRLRRQVALKVLPADLAVNAERKQRFLQEAHAASILVHPHICVVHELGEADGLLFISMEHIEGETLAERMRRGPMTCAEIVDIAVQVADAVDAAHAKGITHRDLKPANIMITARGHVKVLDFGLAKLAEPAEPGDDDSTGLRSVVGSVMGTVPYMSPEQALGLPIDRRTDIFSLGVILYEMATARLPFSGHTPAERIANIAHVTPEAPSRLNHETSPELEQIILKCLGKKPENRYQTGRELEVDLRNIGSSTSPRQSPKTRVLWRAAASIVMLGAVIALAWFLRSKLTEHSDVESLAVLPFVNATHDASNDYLSDGISDTLIDNLSQIPKLRVMARSTTFHYRGQAIDPKRIGKELAVSALLTGDVLARGDSLEIQAELIRSADGSQIWGSRYTGRRSDAASFQQRMTADVVRVIRGRLEVGAQQAKISKRSTDDPEAYQLYLKGQYARNRVTNDSLETAVKYFQKAIDRDPKFALAYVGLADSYLSFEVYADRMTPDSLPRARAAAMKALEIDDTMAEAYASLAEVYFDSWEWAKAEENFKRSIELNPNYSEAHAKYSVLLVTMSRIPEALDQARIAQRLEPLSPVINSETAGVKLIAGQLDEGIGDLNRVIEVEPNMSLAHQWLAFAYLRKRNYDGAIAEVRKEIETSANSTLAIANSAYIYHVAGRKEDAKAAADEVIRRVVLTPALDMACAYISTGDQATAFQWLERGLIDRSGTMNYITWPPWFDEIQKDPRYLSILRRMGLKQYNAG